jgi:FtsP/CotA-like multicopper oxidase with cupredoxin domain
MTLTRRGLLTTFGAALCAPAVLRRAYALEGGHNPLMRLASLDARDSGAFTLTAMPGETAFLGRAASPTLGFNQPYLGPLVRVRPGMATRATVENGAGREISVHWHGLLIEGEVDGGPHNVIPAGQTWRPALSIDQPPATLWYHTHLHRETGEAVYAGLAGVLIVDDGGDADRGLPLTEGVDDLVLVLQDKRFDETGRMVYAPGPADILHGFLGDTVLVNATPRPRASVPAGIVRLRLLNACNGRNFVLSFTGGRRFSLIGTDQGLLPRPIEMERLRLTPGERAEILVDFAAGDATLVSEPHTETHGAGGMDHGMMVPLVDPFAATFDVISFAVDQNLPVAVRSVPEIVGTETEPPAEPVITRRFVLNDMGTMMGGGMMGGGMMGGGMMMGPGPGPSGAAGHMMGGQMMGPGAGDPAAQDMFAINGRSFDAGRLDFAAAAATTERWIVSGQMMGHPFHIHGARIHVVSENGQPPRPENRGWKDTVFVEGETEMVVEIPHPATADRPFMFHCHILEHEDRGMMGQFAVASSA